MQWCVALFAANVTAGCLQKLTPAMWYLAADSAPPSYDPGNAPMVGVYSFIASFVLYGYLIPISLYVSLEMVKVAQARSPRDVPDHLAVALKVAEAARTQAVPVPSPMSFPLSYY